MPALVEPSALSDQQLVRQALANPDDFADLIRRYEPRIRRYALRLGFQGSGQDDVMQDIFMHTWLNLNAYDPARPFAPWLYRIAYTQSMMALRKSRHSRAVISGEDADKFIAAFAAEGSAEQTRDIAHLKGELAQALASLAEKPRAVLILRYLEDNAYLEIAEVLHIPTGTVATLIHRSLRDLKLILTRSGVASIDHWTLP